LLRITRSGARARQLMCDENTDFHRIPYESCSWRW